MVEMVRSPLKWIGGKFHAAHRILAAFPPAHTYTTYLEPCGGAAHVLMAKQNLGHREIYNDLNDDLYNFWYQVQNNADDLRERLRSHPYSRHLYYEYYIRLFDGSQIPPIERATMWFYILRSTGTGWLRDPAGGWNNTEANALAFRSSLELFKPVQERITHPRLVLDNRDVERVIEEYDSPTTLMYVDPPYYGAEYYYQVGMKKYEKKTFDHKRLAELLNAVQGHVALSYYSYPELKDWYPADRWRRMSWQQHKPSSLDAEKEGEELLLMNYAPTRGGLFDEE
jgi:DNA adenine methylase